MGDGLVIETQRLTKRYGPRIVAVDDLDLRVRRGEVYGGRAARREGHAVRPASPAP
jgi:hypothetical protein